MNALTRTDKIYFFNLTISIFIIWIDFLWLSVFDQETPYNILFTLAAFIHLLIHLYTSRIVKHVLSVVLNMLFLIGSLFHFFVIAFSFLGAAFGAELSLLSPFSIIPNTILCIFSGYYVVKNIQNLFLKKNEFI